jgi:hypothetical protein
LNFNILNCLILAGIILIAVGLKKGWFHIQIPYSLTPLSWWFSLYNAAMKFMRINCNSVDQKITMFYNKLIAFFVSSWFFRCQGISTCVCDTNLDHPIPNLCCGVENILNVTGNVIIPGGKTISDVIAKTTNSGCIEVFSFWNWIKNSFLRFFNMIEKQDERNANIYDFVATNMGKKVIAITTLLTLVIFVAFLIHFNL